MTKTSGWKNDQMKIRMSCWPKEGGAASQTKKKGALLLYSTRIYFQKNEMASSLVVFVFHRQVRMRLDSLKKKIKPNFR
jgi:hypothetical protein